MSRDFITPNPEPEAKGRIDSPWALALLLCLLPACSSTYELRGRVVEGPVSSIAVVGKDDPRLGDDGAFGLGGAAIDVTLDPERLNRLVVPRAVSQWSGDFAIPVRATGAGLLEYDTEVVVQLPGHDPAIGQFPLPGRSKRVLITLARGDHRATRPRDGDVLDETIDMGQPYLRD